MKEIKMSPNAGAMGEETFQKLIDSGFTKKIESIFHSYFFL